MTCLSAKEFNWPKDLSGGPKVIKQTGGLDKAQPVAPMSSKSMGILVKLNPPQVSFDAPCTWVIGESSRGKMSGNSESLVIAAVPKLELCAFALIVDPPHVASKVTLIVRIEGDHLNEVASVTEASKLGSINETMTN